MKEVDDGLLAIVVKELRAHINDCSFGFMKTDEVHSFGLIMLEEMAHWSVGSPGDIKARIQFSVQLTNDALTQHHVAALAVAVKTLLNNLQVVTESGSHALIRSVGKVDEIKTQPNQKTITLFFEGVIRYA